jgi:hypothetical protein
VSDYQFAEVRSGLSNGDVVSLVRPDVVDSRKTAAELRQPQQSAAVTQTNPPNSNLR